MPLGNEGETGYEGSVDETLDSTLAEIQSRDSGAPAAAEPAPAVTPSEALTSEPPPISKQAWDDMPRSWKADYKERWGSIEPGVREYIHLREKQALDGITQYKPFADNWNKAVGPYANYVKQYNLDPVNIVNNLTAAHILMQFGTPEQKKQVAQMLDRDYGLAQYYQAAANGQQQQAPQMPDLSPIQNRVQAVEAQLRARAEGDAMQEVESFITNPENKYAQQVAPKMLELLENRQARDLSEAYKIAVGTDPSLFEQIIAERVQAAARTPVPPPKNVRPSAAPARQVGKTRGTIEDTMRETLAHMQDK